MSRSTDATQQGEPRERYGEPGAKRQKRRVAHIQSLLDSGDLRREDFHAEGQLKGYVVSPQGVLLSPTEQQRLTTAQQQQEAARTREEQESQHEAWRRRVEVDNDPSPPPTDSARSSIDAAPVNTVKKEEVKEEPTDVSSAKRWWPKSYRGKAKASPREIPKPAASSSRKEETKEEVKEEEETEERLARLSNLRHCGLDAKVREVTLGLQRHIKPAQKIVAVDLHHTLDDGSRSGTIPEANALAILSLLQAGFIVWICSYIGQSIGQGKLREEESQRKRELARFKIAELAKFLGLKTELVAGPHPRRLFLSIVDRKRWSAYHTGPLNGKAVNLKHHDTEVLFDDSSEICQERSQSGILCYQIQRYREVEHPYKDRNLEIAGFSQPCQRGLPEAVGQFLEDWDTGAVSQKLAVLKQNKRW